MEKLNEIDSMVKETLKNIEDGTVTPPEPEEPYGDPTTWDTTKVTIATSSDNQKVPVPIGWTEPTIDSEKSVDGGYVIKDTNQNEWVWVPVERATYYSMFVESETPIALSGETGATTTRYSASNISGRGKPGDTSSQREPDLVLGNGTQYDYTDYSTAGFSSLNDMATKLVNDYNTMSDSIKKYGGFYIGRYELTENGSKSGVPLLAVSRNWYDLYKKCTELCVDNTKGMTRMIWGCQWDATCNYINTKGDKVNLRNSSNYGNYRDVDVYNSERTKIIKANGTSAQLNTGETTFTMTNNIYDLAGNVDELTQAAYRYSTSC